MIFKPSVTFFKFHTKSIEKFPIRERGVNITNDDDIASEIEVRDDIFNLDLALYFFIGSAHDDNMFISELIICL